MSFVIEHTYCSPEFINLKRSHFWTSYVTYKRAIGLCLCFFLSALSSVLAQPLVNNFKTTDSSDNTLTYISDYTLQNKKSLSININSGYEGRVYPDNEGLLNEKKQKDFSANYVAGSIVTCYNVTSPGVIKVGSGGIRVNDYMQVFCSTSQDPNEFSYTAASGGSGTLYYQWQSSTNNNNWTDIYGATSAGYNPPILTTTTYFRRRAKRIDCDWISSNTIVVVVNERPTVSLTNIDPTCGGNNGRITATGSKGVLGTTEITYELWNNIGGTAVSDLKNNSNYPNNPSIRTMLSSMEGNIDQADNFGGRISGYITPNLTGTYYFWISSDDNGELWLSTDANPANKVKIAYHNSWTSPRDWSSYSTQKSVGINMEAGKIYYIEALYKEGGGGDNLAVGWAKPGQSTSAPSEVIPITAIRPNNSSSVSTPTYQYKLGSNGTYQTSNVFNGIAAGTYTVYIKDQVGCETSSSISLSHTNVVSATASNNGPLCEGQELKLTASSSPAGVTYHWTGPNGFSASTQNVTQTGATANMSGTYTLAVTFGSACAATATTTTIVSINTPPNAPVTTDGTRCGQGSVQLSASGCSGTYNWYSSQTGGTLLGSGNNFNTPSINTTTTYYVECKVGACTSPRTAAVATVKPGVTVTAIGDTNCEGATINLSADGGTTYSWVGPNNFVSNLRTPTISNAKPEMSGAYIVTVTNTSSGCTASAIANVVVNAIPVPVAADVSRCGTGVVTLTASGCSNGTYNWYSNLTTVNSLATGSTYTTPSLSSTTTYYVTCTLNNCTSDTRVPVKAIITPIPAAPTTNPIERCGTGPVTLVADGCAGTIEWYNAASGGSIIGTGNYTIPSLTAPSTSSTSQANTNTYYAGCIVDGCRSTTRTPVVVSVKRLPTATASNTGQHCVGTTFKLIGSGTNAENYSWNGPNGFSSSEQSPLVYSAIPAMAGVYTLTVTAANGCTATATTNVSINSNCTSVCTTPIAVTPTNPQACTGTNSTTGSIFVTEYYGGPNYENSLDGITWSLSENTYSNLPVGYYTVFIRDRTSKIVCRTISITLTSANSSYFTAGYPTSATDCAATNGSIRLEGVLGTDNVSWISSTNRSFVKVSSLSPSNTISNLAPGDYYVVVSRGSNPLCYSERKIEVKNNGTPCPPGFCTQAKSANLFPGGDFGSGSSITGPPLSSGETQYSFAPMNCDSPNDGNYTITNTTDCNGSATGGKVFSTWDILPQDHTPGDVNGYMMIVNASYNPDIVIERTVTNLCPNTRYEYSLWIYNICPASDQDGCTIKPNLTFLIDGVGKYTTGDITATGWQQVGFTFTTGNSTTSTFSIRNNATGGKGNDWAIDDISIIQCLPTIVQSGNITKCIGTTGQTISATVTDANKQYTYYKWQESTDGGATWTDLTSSASATFSSNSTYTVTRTLPTFTAAMNGRKYRVVVATSTANLNNSSCSFNGNETTISVPTININIAGNLNICANGSTTLTASASGGSSPYTYTWSNGLGTGASKTVTLSSTTSYTVTAKDANNCSATVSVQVVVTNLPNAPIAESASKCGAGTLELGATGCSGTVNWYTSETGTSVIAVGNRYITPNISITTTYYVNCNVNGCVSASRTPVIATINNMPTASASGDVQCAGSTINLSANGGNTYNWVGPTGFHSSLQNPAITNATTSMAGLYTVTVISAQGCTATATVNVIVNPSPDLNIAGITTICEGESSTLTATGGNSYLWSTGETTTSINISPTTTTTYTVTAYSINSSYTNLVKDQSIFNAADFSYINSSASYAGPQNLFDGVDNTGSNTFHATRINNGQNWGIAYKLGGEYMITSLGLDARNDCCTDRAKGGVMQVWKNGAMVYQSNVVNGAGNGVISASPSPNVLGDEIRYIFLNGSNTSSGETTLNFAEWLIGGAKVCSASKQITVNVNSKPNATVVSNSPVCAGKSIDLVASGGVAYQWAGPNGFSSTGSAVSINGVTSTTNAGVYAVTITNADGCSATATTNVVINAVPVVTVDSNSPLCAGQTLTFTASGGTSYSWIGPNGYTSETSNASINATTVAANGIYTVTITNSLACSATATVNVIIHDLPTPPTVTGASRCDAGSLTLSADGCTEGVIQWYDAQTGGNLLKTGITFATNTLTESTFYFVSCFTNNCSSPSRTASLARINSAPNAELIPINSTCIASNPQDNGKLLLNRYRSDDRYSYNIGTAYNSDIASDFITIPTDGLVPVSNLPNPTGNSQAYTVRIKNVDGCIIDRTVVLTRQCDACPQNYCVPAKAERTD